VVVEYEAERERAQIYICIGSVKSVNAAVRVEALNCDGNAMSSTR
jgi:hypothetical protein